MQGSVLFWRLVCTRAVRAYRPVYTRILNIWLSLESTFFKIPGRMKNSNSRRVAWWGGGGQLVGSLLKKQVGYSAAAAGAAAAGKAAAEASAAVFLYLASYFTPSSLELSCGHAIVYANSVKAPNILHEITRNKSFWSADRAGSGVMWILVVD